MVLHDFSLTQLNNRTWRPQNAHLSELHANRYARPFNLSRRCLFNYQGDISGDDRAVNHAQEAGPAHKDFQSKQGRSV
ncbi:hypothetical protein OHAE_415 [Ochrobactrum soli]|uniref:Uncharacterized protein n=1 Tax=Ochrobactrum soli TaxID=2448455 RepID=A0A2P9HKD9_9HYPH|nr:hypothetical protein OHAE_415 [[Ochrobactrum] soli]